MAAPGETGRKPTDLMGTAVEPAFGRTFLPLPGGPAYHPPMPLGAPGLAELLAVREARGLQALVVTRQVVLTLFVAGTAIAPHSHWERVLSIAILFGSLAPNGLLFWFARRAKNLGLVGVLGSLLDILLLMLIPSIWYRSVGWTEVPLAYNLKTSFPSLAVVMIAANGIALRPRYPLIVTAGSAAIMLVLIPIVLADPRTQLTDDYVEVMLGSGVSLTFYLMAKLGLVVLAGFTVAVVTAVARRTVFEAAELERLNAEIREGQARVVLEEKLTSQAHLVAGLVHEINNPLGTLRSGIDTGVRSARSLQLLAAQAESLDQLRAEPRWNRALHAIQQNGEALGQASRRISGVIDGLRGFARLDRAAVSDVDVHECLRDVFGVYTPTMPAGVEVREEYAEALPRVRGHARELNQAFHALVDHAVRGLQGSGRIIVRTMEDEGSIVVEIEDSAPRRIHRSDSASSHVQFGTQDNRITATLALPVAESIIHRHRGEMHTRFEAGRGTIYRVALPVDGSDSEPKSHPTSAASTRKLGPRPD